MPSMSNFKKIYHDKLIDGNNRFAPFECKAFLYSRQYLPYYLIAVKKEIEFSMISEPTLDDKPVFEKIELKRVPGPPCDDGYYTYILK